MTESTPVDAVWSVVQTMLTPALVGAIVVTLAVTHTAKIVAEHGLPKVTESASRWRAFCALASVVAGLVCGVGAWLGTDAPWYVVPAVAFGSGPAWRLATAIVPAKVARAFLTATDRRYRERQKS